MTFEAPFPVVVLGLITGMTYGVLAVGLVLIYRSNRIINFAHGEIGAFGAAVLSVAVTRWHVPYWVAFVGALGLSAGVGAATESIVIRRLRDAPKIMSIVATLGVAQFLLLLAAAANHGLSAGRFFPRPTGLPRFSIGTLRVTPEYFAMLFFTPILVAALVFFLRRSRFGIGIRAAASNPDAALMAGISTARMSTLSWALAGAVSAYTAVLVFPTRGFIAYESLGPTVLLRALVAAVIARMTSLPIALATGIGVGVLEALLLWNSDQAGIVDAVLFAVILAALLLQRRQGARTEEKGSWAAVQPWPPIPRALRESWLVRNMGRLAYALLAVFAGVVFLAVSHSTAVTLTTLLAFTLIGLSLGIVTGLGGQLSLGQFAIAGVGAFISQFVVARTGNFVAGFLLAGVVAAVASVLVGLPALRIRGLMLAVTTLSFALAAQNWLFQQPWMFGDGVRPGRPELFGHVAGTGRAYYVAAACVLALGLWLARNVWVGGIGLRLRALRDNEDAARACTVPATAVKLQSFMLAGFLAGLGGAVFGHSLSTLDTSSFPIRSNIDLVAITVIGGLGLLAGPLLGAMYIIGLPAFLPDLDQVGLAATAFGWLLLVMYVPGGLARVLHPVRSFILRREARRLGVGVADVPAAEASPVALQHSLRLSGPAAPAARPLSAVLSVHGLTKRYGGLLAVSHVDLDVFEGETLGLIGPNGAGKTTLFDLLSGFVTPDEGTISYEGLDITRWKPELRGRAGIIRSFQEAALFSTLTVHESVCVALERVQPTPFVPSLIGARGASRRKSERAREILSLTGLERYADTQVGQLSTGTRHIAEIACLLALEPRVLLLDEPSSGIAQRETEALGELLRAVKSTLRTTMVLIEHDMPLIMGLSDRIVAMDAGRICAVGSPRGVRENPIVVESYLGGDVTAIERSGPGGLPVAAR